MISTIESLGPAVARQFPYRSRFATVNGWRMHYVDEGPPDAPPVLLFHGNLAWGFLWRDVVPSLLEAGYRVVIPDQIGFGLSEKPHAPGVHTLDNHAANLVALIDQLDLNNALFVCHDWGGPTGLCALLTREHRAGAVAVMSTWAWAQPSAEFHQRVVPWRLLHAPVVGPYLVGRHAAMPGRGVYLAVVDRERFQQRGRAAYDAVVGDIDERRLNWIWPRSIPLGVPGDIDAERFRWLEEGVRALDKPATLIWGREDEVFDVAGCLPRWQEIWPHAEGPHLVTGNHFLQEDSGNEIGLLLADFAERTIGAS